jgi:hypothetical protein
MAAYFFRAAFFAFLTLRTTFRFVAFVFRTAFFTVLLAAFLTLRRADLAFFTTFFFATLAFRTVFFAAFFTAFFAAFLGAAALGAGFRAGGGVSARATGSGAGGGGGGGGGVEGIGSIHPCPDHPISRFRNSAMRPFLRRIRGVSAARGGTGERPEVWRPIYLAKPPDLCKTACDATGSPIACPDPTACGP